MKTADKSKQTKAQMKAAAIASCKDKYGRIRPEYVVELARDSHSILHHEFEWNMQKGHQIYLIERAKELIREVKFPVTYKNVKLAVPRYISDNADKTSSYIETTSIRKQSAKAKEILADEMVRVRSSLHRAHVIALQFGIGSLWEEMIDLVVKIEKELGD